MSVVTNVILTMNILDEDAIEAVNKFPFPHNAGFTRVENCGGTKALECAVFTGAFNYLNVEDLLIYVRGLEFEEPECVQIFIQKQEEDRFSIFDLSGKIKPSMPSEAYKLDKY
jgi:hypothetical protein